MFSMKRRKAMSYVYKPCCMTLVPESNREETPIGTNNYYIVLSEKYCQNNSAKNSLKWNTHLSGTKSGFKLPFT